MSCHPLSIATLHSKLRRASIKKNAPFSSFRSRSFSSLRHFTRDTLLIAIRKNAKSLKESMQSIQQPHGNSQVEELLIAKVFLQFRKEFIIKGMWFRCDNLCQPKGRLFTFRQVGMLVIVYLLNLFFTQSMLLHRSRPDCSSVAASGKPGRLDAGHFDEFGFYAGLGVDVAHETKKNIQHP